MNQIIECIPNFSEARNPSVLSALEAVAVSVPGASLLDVHSDLDHNRTVFTLAGTSDGMAEVAFLLAEAAVKHIDLSQHTGVHPRIGAVDVIPFVPIKNATMEDCVKLARQVGERIAEELSFPVFLYEEAASSPDRKNLADIRRNAFATASQTKNTSPTGPVSGFFPDFGGDIPHPTAGAVAISARKPLIAFNINLNTTDLNIAKAIAEAVRGSNGGLAYCKALGLYLQTQNITQVSMNLVDYEQTPIYRVFEMVKREAARYGVNIIGS